MEINTLLTIVVSIFAIPASVVTVILFFKSMKKLKLNNDNGFYYYDDKPKIPYCPKCYEGKGRKTKLPDNRICPKCKSNYQRNPFVHVIKLNNHTSKFRLSNL